MPILKFIIYSEKNNYIYNYICKRDKKKQELRQKTIDFYYFHLVLEFFYIIILINNIYL